MKNVFGFSASDVSKLMKNKQSILKSACGTHDDTLSGRADPAQLENSIVNTIGEKSYMDFVSRFRSKGGQRSSANGDTTFGTMTFGASQELTESFKRYEVPDPDKVCAAR